MSNQFGPSEDCPVCGQPAYPNEWRICHICGDEMCYHCMANHVCSKCVACKREVNKAEDKYLEDYGEWVCGDECHIEFLNKIIEKYKEENKYDIEQLAKKAALEERRNAI